MGSTIAHSASVRSLGERRPLRSAARRCSGVHIGRSSKENQAPDKESHPIHQTQELPGSALRLPRSSVWNVGKALTYRATTRLYSAAPLPLLMRSAGTRPFPKL